MNLIRLFFIVFALAFSGQASALFMPAGFQIVVDFPVDLDDSGC